MSRSNSWTAWLWVLAFAALLAMPMVACQPDGPAEDAGEEIDDATGDGDTFEDAGEAVDEAVDDAGDAMEDAMEEAGDAMEEAGDEVEDALDGDGGEAIE
jgi:hypothetical protein